MIHSKMTYLEKANYLGYDPKNPITKYLLSRNENQSSRLSVVIPQSHLARNINAQPSWGYVNDFTQHGEE